MAFSALNKQFFSVTTQVGGGSPDRVTARWPGVKPTQTFMCCVWNPRNINIFGRVPSREDWGDREIVYVPNDIVYVPFLAPNIARHCDTIAAIPHIARYIFRELALPQNGAIHPLVLSSTQAHLCDTPFCNISRNNCAIQHLKSTTKSLALLSLPASRDIKTIAAGPLSLIFPVDLPWCAASKENLLKLQALNLQISGSEFGESIHILSA